MKVVDWLLDGDPAIRWQAMGDPTDASAAEVATERARVAVEGWGAALLELQGDDGRWDGGTHRPPTHVEIDGPDGTSSPWNTLRALRVLRWAGQEPPRGPDRWASPQWRAGSRATWAGVEDARPP